LKDSLTPLSFVVVVDGFCIDGLDAVFAIDVIASYFRWVFSLLLIFT
jgi:hypothetical protein